MATSTRRQRRCAPGLEVAIDELRDLVHGVMPALLIERGLHAATEELVDRMPIPTEFAAAEAIGPLPATVESTAFFVVAEGLANARQALGCGADGRPPGHDRR